MSPESKRYDLDRYIWNPAVVCFQVKRTTIFKSGQTSIETLFQERKDCTLGYLCFESANYVFTDDHIAVWKIKKKHRKRKNL